MVRFIILLLATSLLFSNCSTDSKPDVLAVNIDSSTAPSDDFFQYAHGNWFKKNPIPDAYAAWGIGNLVREDIYLKLRKINDDALQASSKDDLSKKIADFWQSAMDTVAIEQQQLSPLQPLLQQISNAANKKEILLLTSSISAFGPSPFFTLGINQDLKNSDKMMLYFMQGGIGLPDRDYYFNTDERTSKVREAYQNYLKNVFVLIGADSITATAKAKDVYQIELSLAKASRKLEALRDPYKNYNKMVLAELSKLCPTIPWNDYLLTAGIKNIDSIIISQPEFFTSLEKELTQRSLEQLKNYLTLQLIRSASPYLSQRFYMNNFNFYSKILSGAKTPKDRWKRVIDTEDGLFGEALGQLFVKEFFNSKAKKRYEDMVEAIRTAMKERIEQSDWMSDSTKQKALHKLAVMKKKVGYPEKWKDFSAMKIGKQPYVINVMNANKWWTEYTVAKLYKPVDRTAWSMNPQTYNAGYEPSQNTITLPAGIFIIPGYKDEELDDAVVYGYAGASTIGHEICHGFDDEGRQFDADGNLKNWWTKEDEEKFKQRAEVMVKQFNDIIALDSLHLNGLATLGENIADFAGIILGWEAFKKTDQYKKGKKIAGLTPAQRYFMGYAIGWLHHSRKEYLQQIILSDVHAPAKYRVNVPFSNLPAFYEAFGIKEGSKMYRPDSTRVNIW